MTKYMNTCPECGATALPEDKQPVSGTHCFTMIYECKSRYDYVIDCEDDEELEVGICANKCGEKYMTMAEQMAVIVRDKKASEARNASINITNSRLRRGS